MPCSPKAFKWPSFQSTKKVYKMRACAEFYCRQISSKFSLKFPLCITNLIRLIQTSLLLFFVPRLLSFVPPRKSTNKQTDVSVQPTGKWIERIQPIRTRAFLSYVIKSLNYGNNKMFESDWFLTTLIYCLIWLVQHQTVRSDLSDYQQLLIGQVKSDT